MTATPMAMPWTLSERCLVAFGTVRGMRGDSSESKMPETGVAMIMEALSKKRARWKREKFERCDIFAVIFQNCLKEIMEVFGDGG